MRFEKITIAEVNKLSKMFVETFNSAPWNDKWTMETATKRLSQMINCEEAYGIAAYEDEKLCGMILGAEEQYYNGVVFNIKEFCVSNEMRSMGLGKVILNEFETRLNERKINEITLLTSKDERTEGFYRKRGYKSENEMIIMKKKI